MSYLAGLLPIQPVENILIFIAYSSAASVTLPIFRVNERPRRKRTRYREGLI
jgi:hypothetical protein